MPDIKLRDGRWIDRKELCTACRDGRFYQTKPRTVNIHLSADVYEEVWRCDRCGGTSLRRWTK